MTNLQTLKDMLRETIDSDSLHTDGYVNVGVVAVSDLAAAFALIERVERAEAALGPFARIVPSSIFMADGSEGETYRIYLANDKGPHDLNARDLAAARSYFASQEGK